MTSFNAKFIPLSSEDRLYRILFADGRAYFINIGGPRRRPGWLGALANRWTASKTQRLLRALETGRPSAFLSESEDNFCALPSDFEFSTLYGPSIYGGAEFGSWMIQLRDRKPMALQFESAEDMKRALEVLPSFMRHHVNEISRNRFVKAA